METFRAFDTYILICGEKEYEISSVFVYFFFFLKSQHHFFSLFFCLSRNLNADKTIGLASRYSFRIYAHFGMTSWIKRVQVCEGTAVCTQNMSMVVNDFIHFHFDVTQTHSIFTSVTKSFTSKANIEMAFMHSNRKQFSNFFTHTHHLILTKRLIILFPSWHVETKIRWPPAAF